MTVKISFNYEPDEPDEDDSTGMSLEEYERVTEHLMSSVGAESIQVEKVE